MKRCLIISPAVLISALFLSSGNQWIIAPAALVSVLAVYPPAGRVFFSQRAASVSGVLVVLPPLFVGERSASFLGVAFNPAVLAENQVMALRSILVLMAIRVFTGGLSLHAVEDWIRRKGFSGLGRVLKLSRLLTPRIRRMVEESYIDFRSRWRREKKWKHLSTFVVSLGADIVMLSEEKVPEGKKTGSVWGDEPES